MSVRIAIALFSLLTAFSAWANSLTFGVYADRPEQEMEARYQPLVDYLNEQLPDAQIALKILSEDEIMDGATKKQLDLVLTHPFQYLRLREKNLLSATLATRFVHKNDRSSNAVGGVFLSQTGRTDIAELTDLKGRSVAVSKPENFLGCPQLLAYELMQVGLDIPKDVRLTQLENQQNVIDAVLSGRADIGFVRSGVFETLVREKKLKSSELHVINRQDSFEFPYLVSTRLYPEWPLVALRHVQPAVSRQIARALLALEKTHPAAVAAHIEGFVPPADYLPVERMAHALRMPPYDAVPTIVWRDLWENYRIQCFALCLALSLLTIAAVALTWQRRKALGAEHTLRMEKRHLENVIRGMNVGTWEWNVQTGETVVNERWVEIGGYHMAELLPVRVEDWTERVHPDDRDFVNQQLQRCFRRESEIYDCEIRIWHSDGRWIWVQDQGRVVEWSADSRPLRVSGTRHDISERKRNETIVANSEKRLRTIFAALPVGIALFDREGYIIECNAALEEMFEIDRTEQLVHKFNGGGGIAYRPDGTRMPLGEFAYVRAQAEQQPIQDITMEIRRTSAESIWLNVNAAPLDHPSYGVVMTCVDITQARQTEARLQLAASVFTHAREGIMIADANATIIDVNAAFTEITGYEREEIIGRKPGLLNSGMQTADFYADMWQHLREKGYWYGELWNRRKNGEIYPEMQNISAVLDANGRLRHYVSLSTDITQIKAHQKQLEYIAHYDVLTNLPNRLLFAEHLHQAMAQVLRRDMQLAVIYLDLDGFKPINDRHGHSTGDNLLVDLAQSMRSVLREGDIIARLGGDEFAAVLVDLNTVMDCQLILERLLHAISDPIEIDGKVLRVSASIGYTLYPKDDVDADLLLRHADLAMYSAKQQGKNCACLFDATHNVETESAGHY